jgi:hypothetical protein
MNRVLSAISWLLASFEEKEKKKKQELTASCITGHLLVQPLAAINRK